MTISKLVRKASKRLQTNNDSLITGETPNPCGKCARAAWAQRGGGGGGGRASIYTQKISTKRHSRAHWLVMGKKAKKQRQDSKKKAKKHNQQKNAIAPDSITAIFKVK